MLDKILDHLKGQSQAVIDLQRELVAIPALGPENDQPGCPGEKPKADFLVKYLNDLGISDITEINAPDPRVACGFRPNLAAVIPGRDQSRTFWVISHTDIVPPGDLGLWNSDPYALKVEGDVMTGRGVEDNHQGIVSSLILARTLLELEITPAINLGLLLVSDEETGSGYGLDYIVENRPDIFEPNDLILVPDFGTPDSTLIEVSEKSMLWLKASFKGKQCHASTPQQGVNTLRAVGAFIVKLEEIENKFNGVDELFNPPRSTFEPTKKEANVPNINTVPGFDVMYVDCRVLPRYDLDEVMREFERIAREVEEKSGVAIEFDTPQRGQAAPPTPTDSQIVTRLIKGIENVYGAKGNPSGIGGGTVAAFLRRKGLEAAVWSTCVHNAHQPNESSLISSQIKDAQVMAWILMSES